MKMVKSKNQRIVWIFGRFFPAPRKSERKGGKHIFSDSVYDTTMTNRQKVDKTDRHSSN